MGVFITLSFCFSWFLAYGVDVLHNASNALQNGLDAPFCYHGCSKLHHGCTKLFFGCTRLPCFASFVSVAFRGHFSRFQACTRGFLCFYWVYLRCLGFSIIHFIVDLCFDKMVCALALRIVHICWLALVRRRMPCCWRWLYMISNGMDVPHCWGLYLHIIE